MDEGGEKNLKFPGKMYVCNLSTPKELPCISNYKPQLFLFCTRILPPCAARGFSLVELPKVPVNYTLFRFTLL